MSDITTFAVNFITEPEQAEPIVAAGKADRVSPVRAMRYDPRRPWHAAARLDARMSAPKRYRRSQPREFEDPFEDASTGQR